MAVYADEWTNVTTIGIEQSAADRVSQAAGATSVSNCCVTPHNSTISWLLD